MKIKIKTNRIVSLCLALSMILSIGFSQNVSLQADSISDLEKETERLEKEQKEINSKLNSNSNKIKQEKERQALLEQQIINVKDQIALYEQKIELLESQIEVKNAEIDTKLVEIEDNEVKFSQRVRAMYIANSNASTLTTLLGAKSFSDFLNRAEIIKRISQSDRELIDTLTSQKEELNRIKTEQEKQQADLVAAKNTQANKQTELTGYYNSSEAAELELVKKEKEYMRQKEQNKKLIDQNEAEIRKLLEASNMGEAPEGEFKWPIPASSRVTSPFGYRTLGGVKEFHQGLDIAAPKGTDIVAAQSGKVILVKKQDYGYGWYLMIDHGGGYATLYAHTSAIDVNVGDTVARGQVIAHVGTTGNSTGYHCHFEVRVNGQYNDPMKFVVKP